MTLIKNSFKTSLLVSSIVFATAAQAQSPVAPARHYAQAGQQQGYVPHGPQFNNYHPGAWTNGPAPWGQGWNNGYNNTPWNSGWMPWNSGNWNNGGWNNGYNDGPWSWMPWGNNSWGNNNGWNGNNDGPWDWVPWGNGNNNGWNNGYNDAPWDSSWMPWNFGDNNGWGGNNWDGMFGPFDGFMDGDGELAMDFDMKFTGKGRGRGNSNAYGRGYVQGYGNNYPQYYYPPVAVAPPKEDKDSDRDGVLLPFDICPNSAPATEVNAFGCEANQQIVLRGVNFHTDSDKLTDTSTGILDNVATTLSSHPEIKVEVGGHTDSDGDAVYNKDLSQRRASSVVTYLMGKGVATDNMQAMGYGEEKPIATNETKEGRASNRRVELTRLGK